MIIEINQTIAAVGIFVKPYPYYSSKCQINYTRFRELRNRILKNVFLFHKKDRGIIGSSRLEKPSKIIKSSRHPNITTPANPCPQGQHLQLF